MYIVIHDPHPLKKKKKKKMYRLTQKYKLRKKKKKKEDSDLSSTYETKEMKLETGKLAT